MAKRKKKPVVSLVDLGKYTLPAKEAETVQKAPSLTAENPSEEGSSSFIKGTKGKIWTAIMLFMFVVAALSSVLIFKNKTDSAQMADQTLIEETPTASPISNKQMAKNSDYAIEVLNGSGVAGEAAKLKELLEESGFKVSSIGNATEPTERTIVSAKNDLPDEFAGNLQEFLDKYYLLAPEIETDEAQDSDVLIIIGREQK